MVPKAADRICGAAALSSQYNSSEAGDAYQASSIGDELLEDG